MSPRFGQVPASLTPALQKCWTGRRMNLMKKADDIHQKFGARVALFIEIDGVLHAYLSEADYPMHLPGLLLDINKTTPNDFITVAQQKMREKACDFLPPQPTPVETPRSHSKARRMGPKQATHRVTKAPTGRAKTRSRAYFGSFGAEEQAED